MARVDLSLPLVAALILVMGLVTLNSAAPGTEFSRQVTFLVGGAAICGLLMWVGKKRLVRFAPYLYVLSILLLLLTRVMGTVVNGAKSWLILGPLPGFQPSELAKLALILALATILHERPIRGLVDYLKVGAIIVPPVALVFDEPDLGSALVLAALAAGMVLIRGVPWRQLVLIAIVTGVAVPPPREPASKTASVWN